MADDKKLSGRFARFGRLGAAALGTSGRYLGGRMADVLRDEEGRIRAQSERLGAAGARLAETMGELKGAAMKLGQMLSVDNEVLPEEMRRAMAVLQRQAPPMATDTVRRLVSERLGQPLEEVFATFDDEPLGAASLGQVHGATLMDGRSVAVKVQYPGIGDTVASDMANLKLMLKMAPIPALRGRVDGYVEELTAAFEQEADYLQEAANLRLFVGLVEGLEGVVVPMPIDELCSRELLVMERLNGQRLSDSWAQLDQQGRDRMGERLMRFFAETFHRERWLHGDPHPGNFMALDDGRLGILDLGCVRRFEEGRGDAYLRLLRAIWDGDDEGAAEVYHELGYGRGRRPVSPAVIAAFNCIGLAPFYAEGPFDFGAWSMKAELKSFLLHHPEFLRFTPPPEDLLYLRVMSGLRGMLNEGGCRLDVRRHAQALCDERL